LNQGQLKLGTPVLLWRGRPGSEEQQRGVVKRLLADRLGVVVPADYGEFVQTGRIHLEKEVPQTAFKRGHAALKRFSKSRELITMAELLFGSGQPNFDAQSPPITFRDERLNASQQEAVTLAMRAQDIALIHGPPGTGKTRTLVEVVRQALVRQQSVLVATASNTALDNLVARMMSVGLKPLRLGHPARVTGSAEARTLDALVEQTDERAAAQKQLVKAALLRKRHGQGPKRKKTTQRDSLAQADRCTAESRRLMRSAKAKVLRRFKIVCTTAAGADAELLESHRFDLLVLDEATQAPDPLALSVFQRGTTLVLAGDPKQLPPTVVDPAAASAGLGTTLFERTAERWGASCVRMLTVQYRMHETLMAFPSESMYGGKLEAAKDVRQRLLEDLPGVKPDKERPGPWVFLDTRQQNWHEEGETGGASIKNPKQAECTVAEVERLLARGVNAVDIAVISPYAAQVKLLRALLSEPTEAGLEIGTVDAFQGREKEAVLVDLVRANAAGALGFLTDVRRMNVALTRARRFLTVVGHGTTLEAHDYYCQLIEAAKRCGAWRDHWS